MAEARDSADALLAPVIDALAASVADQVFPLLEERLGDQSPWLTKDEAVAYTRMARSTFEAYAADGRIPSHGGKRKVFHKAELDAALFAM